VDFFTKANEIRKHARYTILETLLSYTRRLYPWY